MNKMTPLAAALIAMTGFGLSTTAVADDVENRTARRCWGDLAPPLLCALHILGVRQRYNARNQPSSGLEGCGRCSET